MLQVGGSSCRLVVFEVCNSVEAAWRLAQQGIPAVGMVDPISAAGFDELIQQLREWFRLTIVIITHDLDSLWRIADRVAVLGNGKVLGIGSMSELSGSKNPLIHEYFYGPRGRAAKEQAWNQR